MPTELFVIEIAVLILSIVLHEVSHGIAADALGDPTARWAGRLSLNPIRHLDLWGSLLVPLFLIAVRSPVLFGWAKPVPYNPYNLRNQRWGPAVVGAAGPAANIAVAAVFGVTLRLADLPPSVAMVAGFIVFINILLAVFNLVPIPPLDGSKVLFALLPARYERWKMQFEAYGFFLVLLFIFFFFPLLLPVVRGLYGVMVGLPFGAL